MMMLTSAERETSHTDTSHATSHDADGVRLESRVDIVPDEAGPDVRGLRVLVVCYPAEAVQRDMDALCRRKAWVRRMASALHL